MGVDRTEWGLGLGGMMLDATIAWARANPILHRIGLQVFIDNEHALALYASRGFRDEGTMNDEVLIEGRYQPLRGMSLDVSSAG